MNEEKQLHKAQSGRIPYWFKVVTVFFFGWVVLYAARQILAPLMGEVQLEFGLNKKQLGLIMSVFFLAYAALQIPSGILGDKIGKKKVLVPGFLLFGLFVAFTGMTTTFVYFLTAWIIVGAAQGTYYGPQYAVSSEAIPERRITLGSAIINSGMAFGTSIGFYISSYVTLEWGFSWRVPFYIMAVPIILVSLAMAKIIKERPKPEPELDENGDEKEPFQFLSLFKNRNLILSYITIFCSIYGFFMILTWLPYYLENERNITGGNIAFVSSLLPWAAIPGSIFFSYLSDRLGRRRPVLMIMLPLAFIATASIVYFESMAILYTALILYGIVGKISTNPVLIAVVANNAPKSAYSTAFSVYNFIGMCASILAPYITGFIYDQTESMANGFYLAAGLLLIGFISVLFLKEDKPVPTEA
ncbi:MAG TPA: MFS transporter [Candidatus Avamphibacillus intestinigallinarum]|nr:MFS transporter [Candidatus Avamphibacillus intestinigallinarum]